MQELTTRQYRKKLSRPADVFSRCSFHMSEYGSHIVRIGFHLFWYQHKIHSCHDNPVSHLIPIKTSKEMRQYSLICTWQPVAIDAPSMHFRTPSTSLLSPFCVGLRTCQTALVYDGMILATFGVSMNAQWIRLSGKTCAEILLYAATRASSASTPSHGFPPAWRSSLWMQPTHWSEHWIDSRQYHQRSDQPFVWDLDGYDLC